MRDLGHNESAVRLAALAGDAQIALDRVACGEFEATEGWLAYGAALNEGRALFAGDAEFGKWVADNSLCQLGTAEVDRHERAAAMWAAANADQLADAKAASKARTLRGWHDQWKKIETEREAAQQEADRKTREDAARREAEVQAKAEADARKAAASATTEEERREAESKADQAALARVEAEKAAGAAHVATAEPEPEQAEEDPTRRVLREQFRELEPHAQEDDFVDLYLTVGEREAEVDKLKVEIAEQRAILTGLSRDGEGKTLAALRADRERADRKAGDLMNENARLQVRVNAQSAEIKKLKAEIEKLKAESKHLRENQVINL